MFAMAAAQVKKGLEITKKLGGAGFGEEDRNGDGWERRKDCGFALPSILGRTRRLPEFAEHRREEGARSYGNLP